MIVGIDLGTTHSLVAVLRAEGPEVLPGPDGSPLIPSAVALAEDGTLLVGAAAVARMDREPTSGARFFKRDMGTDRRYRVGAREYSAVELSAIVLREARDVARAHLGETVKRAVITVPAYFQEPQRAATAEAASLAGLELARTVNEPTAAALAYGAADATRERRVAVLDLGGGTFDVTLLDVFDGVIEVVGTGGDGRLGGEDFTDVVWTEACRRAGLSMSRPSMLTALLRRSVEEAKCQLASVDFVRIPLPRAGAASWEEAGAFTLTAPDFARRVEPLLERLAACVRNTMTAARRTTADIDEVVLAGGATRMACVRDIARAMFGRDGLVGPDPDLAVALGAALQGGLIVGHRAVSEVVVTDVLSHSLGVEITRQGEDRFLPGYYLPVLHRNTTPPTSGETTIRLS